MLTFVRQRTRRTLPAVAALVLSSTSLYASLAWAADPADPRLLQSVAVAADAGGVDSLQHTLKKLAVSMQRDTSTVQTHQTRALQSALHRLAKPTTPQWAPSAPRLRTAQSALQARHDGNALSALASGLITLQAELPSQRPARDVTELGDLRRAMRRFDMVTDTLASETFSRVLLGLSDLTPMLSDDLMTYPEVAKRDLRERVIMARVNAAHPGLADLTDDASPQLQAPTLAVAPMVAPNTSRLADATVTSEQITQLETPVGELALSGMNAAPDRTWSDIGATGELYADAEDLDLDKITLDDLGSTSVASLDGPVAADDLEDTRAGFVLNNGVKIDFAVTRYTSIDGIDQLHTIANLPEGLNANALSQISGGRLSNTRVLKPDTGSAFTVVQNDLNNQRIIDVTTIDVDIKNFGLRSIDFVRPSLQNDAIPAELRR